jgi:hypothetical protein
MSALNPIAQAIHDEMRSVIDRLGGNAAAIATANEALNTQRADDVTGREGTLRTLATMSMTGQWPATDISAGIIAAVAGTTNMASSVKAFTNECLVVMSPAVRSHFEDIANACVSAWVTEDGERTLDKSVPTPVRKAFKRRYHTIMAAARALTRKNNPVLLDTPELVVEFARQNDPDVDPAAAFKRVEALRDELSTILLNFPTDDLRAAFDAMADVTETGMVLARNNMLARERAAHEARVTPTPAPAPTPEPTPETADTILDGRKPMPGAVDLGALTTPYNGAAFQRAA